MVKQGYFRNEVLGFSKLALLYDSWELLYNPELDLNTHSRNTLSLTKKEYYKEYYGSEGLLLSNLTLICTISNTLKRYQTIPK